MKHASEINIVVSDKQSEKISKDEKRKTWAFVSSVMSLYYADIDVSKLDGIKATCLTYHSSINGFSEAEFSNRLKMIKAISEVPSMPGLHGRYRTANEALRVACGELCNLQHDYYVVVPKSYSTGALESINKQQIEYYRDPEAAKEQAKKGLSQLKGIFGENNG